MNAKLLKVQRDSMDLCPIIRLRGEWLQKLGFEIGKMVLVEVRDGELVLSVIVEDEN